MAEQTVTLRITADAKDIPRAIGAVNRQLASMGDAGKKGGSGAAGGIAQVRVEMERTSSVAKQLKGFLGGLATAFLSFQTVKAVAHLADEWSDLSSLVRVNIGETEDASEVMGRLAQVARSTYSSLSDTAQGFAQNATTLNALGKSTQQQLDYLSAVNNALVVSGAKGQQFQQVQDALNKAMATGSLHGIELNTVLTRGSAITEALADELGVSALELRKLGEQGKITGDVIFTALSRRMKELEERAESMPATISDSFTILRNALLETVGYADSAAGSTNGIAEAIINLADIISRPEVKEGFAAIAIGAVNAAAEVAKLFGAVKALADFGGRLAGMKMTGWLDPDDLELNRVKFRELSDELARIQAGESSFLTATASMREARIAYLREEIAKLQENAKQAIIQQAQIQQAADEAAAASKTAAEEAERQRQAALGSMRALVAGSKDAAASARDQVKAEAERQARLAATAKRMSDNALAAHNFRQATADLAAQLDGPLAVAEREHQKRMDELQELLFEGTITYDEAAEAAALYGKELDDTREKFDDTTESAQELENILRRFDNIGMSGIVRDLELVKAAMAEATDPAQIAQLQAALGHLQQEALEYATGALGAGIQSLKSMASEGSKAYAALEVAQTALNLATAIGAIANQGMGDPYTAFARIASMAALMSQFVDGLGAVRGGFSGGAAQRQETQGTGSILGDATAKSESIARAVEITANAVTQLVGINRSMLTAMQNLQAGLTGAGTLIARGAGDVEFGGARNMNLSSGLSNTIIGVTGGVIGLVLDKVLGGAFTNILNKLIGGKSKVTDQGIMILGGALGDMLENITAGAFQEVQSRSWWFGSTHTNTQMQGLGDDVTNQLQLVLGSMADAVRAGAEALGLDMEAINRAIESYQIAEIKISTMDLSAEEAQKELEAVFSKIFDGLAGAVVPFIGQFQKVGEGLGETLIRVATGVQVTQEAVKQLGFALDETDPERLAQISTSLMDLAGGVDAFIEGMSSFVNAFATDQHKFKVAQDALTSAFEQFGLVVPDTRDGMWDLMQSLDATTEAGREQIAMLLQLADVADGYYQMLEDREARAAAIDAALADNAWDQYLDGLTAGQRAIEETTKYYDDWRDSLIAAGATTEQLAQLEDQRAVAMARVYEAEAVRLAQAEQDYVDFIAGIWRETQNLSDYQAAMRDTDSWRSNAIAQANEHARAAGMAGASEQALALIERRASQLRAQALAQLREETQSLVDQLYGNTGISDAFTSGLGDASSAAADYWAQQRRAAETLQQYLDSMLLGDLSALTPEQQLAEAWNQLNAAVGAGDADQATRLADVYLRMLREMEASGDDYNQGFWSVRELLQGMLDDIGDVPDAVAGGTDSSSLITVAGAEQIAAQNRLDLAVQLAQHLADLSSAVGQTIFELMDSMGVDLRTLAGDLGISLQTITGETVLALVNMADLLGVNLLDLTGELGLQLTALGGGIRELAEQTGINLDALTVESVQALGTLANQLGIDLADIATSVGTDLGHLADSQSLLNQALKGEIDKLPGEQANALSQYLEAIETATTEADANDAINTMADYINDLTPDIRDALAPYFSKVFPADALSDLDYLTSISASTADMAAAMGEVTGLLERIANNVSVANVAAGLPSYAVGTGYVPQDGLAMIHQGESIIPAPFTAWLRAEGFPISREGSDHGEVVAELRQVNARLERLERATDAGAGRVVEAVIAGDRGAYNQREELARRDLRRGQP